LANAKVDFNDTVATVCDNVLKINSHLDAKAYANYVLAKLENETFEYFEDNEQTRPTIDTMHAISKMLDTFSIDTAPQLGIHIA
jgi:hypothetical protein